MRIEYGSSSGMCTGYCYSETTIQPMTARSVSRTNFSLNGYRDKEQPDMKIKWKITTEEWERAKAAIDPESLFAFPDRIGCPGCLDEPVDWITVKYSDGTEKSVICNRGGPATDVSDKIKAAIARVPARARKGPRPMVPLPSSKQPGHERAVPLRVLSIRFVSGGGFGCVVYCSTEINVRPGRVSLLERPLRDRQQQNPQKYRDLTVDIDLSENTGKNCNNWSTTTLFCLARYNSVSWLHG